MKYLIFLLLLTTKLNGQFYLDCMDDTTIVVGDKAVLRATLSSTLGYTFNFAWTLNKDKTDTIYNVTISPINNKWYMEIKSVSPPATRYYKISIFYNSRLVVEDSILVKVIPKFIPLTIKHDTGTTKHSELYKEKIDLGEVTYNQNEPNLQELPYLSPPEYHIPEPFFIPNIINPNSSIKENQTFKVFGTDDYEIKIYNRQGELIYQGKEWTGSKQGTYIYLATIGKYYRKGTVMVE